MKKILLNIFYGLCLAGTLAACSGSKRMVKKAVKYEQQGLFKEASQFYMDALRRDNENIDARIGLQKSGQRVLDDLFGNFFKAQTNGDHRTVVYDYLTAKAYYDDVKAYQVELQYPSYYDEYFAESKDIYLAETYEKANGYYDQRMFSQSEKLYAEIIRLEGDYRQARQRLKVSKVEPLYVQGMDAFEQMQYRKAYDYFDRVLAQDREYKDAASKKQEALELGRFTIGMLPFKNLTYHRNMEDRVGAYFMNEMVNAKNPFIKVVDREHTDRILNEQKLGLSGVMDEASAAEAGKLLGVKAILTGKLVSFKPSEGKLRKTTHSGREEYRVKIYVDSTDSYTHETRYRPARYYELEQKNSVLVSFQYSLVSSETGEVLLSDLIEKHFADEIEYASYKGDYKNLYPIYKGTVQKGYEKRKLDDRFKRSKNIQSVEELSQKAFRAIAKDMVHKVMDYEKNRN